MAQTTFESLRLQVKVASLPSLELVNGGVQDFAVPDSPNSKVSVCSSGISDLSSLPVIPSFSSSWSRELTSSLQTWQSWELPFPASHSFLSSAGQKELPDSRVVQKWREEVGGMSPSSLAFLAALPSDGTVHQAVTDQLHVLMKWDSWMKNHGSEAESCQLAKFAAAGDQSDAPRRLAKKFPLLVEAFSASLKKLSARQEGSGTSSNEHGAMWGAYAYGLNLHHKLKAVQQSQQTPESSEFLLCRGLTSGFLQVVSMAAQSKNKTSAAAGVMGTVRPLIALASMLVASFSDLFLASRRQEQKGASLSAVEVYDDEWAVVVHNTLLVQFHEEADALVQGSSSEGEVRRMVDVVKASLHGMMLWYQTAPAFRVREFELPSVHVLTERYGFSADATALDRTSLPSWAVAAVGKATDDLVAAMKQ